MFEAEISMKLLLKLVAFSVYVVAQNYCRVSKERFCDLLVDNVLIKERCQLPFREGGKKACLLVVCCLELS